MSLLVQVVLVCCLAVTALAVPVADGGHGHGGYSSHGVGHGHEGHGGYAKTIHGDPELVHTETHGKVSHPTITTKIKLVSKPYPVKVPIKIPIVKHVPVTKTFKNVKTIKVPVHITKEVPFEVVKTIKVPIKSHNSYSSHTSHGHHGGFSDFGHGGGYSH